MCLTVVNYCLAFTRSLKSSFQNLTPQLATIWPVMRNNICPVKFKANKNFKPKMNA